MTAHTATGVDRRGQARAGARTAPPRLLSWAPLVAGAWSAAYLALSLSWLAGAGGWPWAADPTSGFDISLMSMVEPRTGAWLVLAASALGLVLSAAGWVASRRPVDAATTRTVALASAVLGILLAVVVPDFRLLAGLGYTPILIVGWIVGFARDVSPAEAFGWPWSNLLVLSLAGLAFLAISVAMWRRAAEACLHCGRRGAQAAGWRGPEAARRWGRWAVAVAAAVPVGYAVTRFAWALGFDLGLSDETFNDIKGIVGFGAGLGAFAVLGALLTIGLARPWGEVFPRWVPGLRSRRVPVGVAVVPAAVVSVAVTSAGLMFLRMLLLAPADTNLPVTLSTEDLAGWLPEMFWPLWGVALAAATYAYWLRRRGECAACGRG